MTTSVVAFAIIAAVVVAVVVTLFTPFLRRRILGRILNEWRRSAHRGSHRMGYRYSDQHVEAGNALARYAGAIVVIWMIAGAVLMFGSIIVGLIVSGAGATDWGIFGPLALIGMIGGIFAPVVLLATVGIVIAACFGAQSLSRYGWVVGLPFGLWFVGGLVVCNFRGITDSINDVLSRLGIDAQVFPLLPWWVYVVVLAVLGAGFFVLGWSNKRTSGPAPDQPADEAPGPEDTSSPSPNP